MGRNRGYKILKDNSLPNFYGTLLVTTKNHNHQPVVMIYVYVYLLFPFIVPLVLTLYN